MARQITENATAKNLKEEERKRCTPVVSFPSKELRKPEGLNCKKGGVKFGRRVKKHTVANPVGGGGEVGKAGHQIGSIAKNRRAKKKKETSGGRHGRSPYGQRGSRTNSGLSAPYRSGKKRAYGRQETAVRTCRKVRLKTRQLSSGKS